MNLNITKNTTTLYIGDTSIRLMVTRGKRITKLADLPLDASLSEITTPEQEAELIEKIKLLFKTNKISKKKIILGISGLHCLTRPVTLPELPRAMLNEAIIREAKRVLPVSPEQLYITWQTVTSAEGSLKAFMVAIPRHIADTLVSILNRAGYRPYLMDIKPLALARLARENTAIIVDVQTTEFDIVIMVNGTPQPIRTVPFPQEVVSLSERLSIVIDEVRRTIEFYNANNQENALQENDTMLVSGELVDEPEFYEPLAQELGFKVELLASPLKCGKQLDPSRHLVNIGLALKELSSGSGPLLPNFNTLPEPYLPKQMSLNRVIAIPAGAVAIGSIVLLGLTIQDAAAAINQTRNELDMNNVLLLQRQAQKKQLTTEIQAMQQTIAMTESAQVSYATALNRFNELGDAMNADLQATFENMGTQMILTSVSHYGDQLRLIGQAVDEIEIMAYVRRLTATGRFPEITIAGLVNNISLEEEPEGEGEGEGEGGDTSIYAMSFTLILQLEESIE